MGYAVYYQNQQKKNTNKRSNKKAINQQPHQAQKGKNNKKRKTKLSSTNNSEDDPLNRGIKIPIKKKSESENNSVKDDNIVGEQLSLELKITIKPIKPTRTRRLPLKYQE